MPRPAWRASALREVLDDGPSTMTKMRSFRLPQDQLDQLKQLASRRHDDNQTQALLEAIDRYYQDLNPPRLQGYVRLDRVSRGSARTCANCERSAVEANWLAVYSNGTVKGSLCDECAQVGIDGA